MNCFEVRVCQINCFVKSLICNNTINIPKVYHVLENSIDLDSMYV